MGGNDYSEDDMGKEKWCKRYVSRRGEANVILQRQRRLITFSGTQPAATSMEVRQCKFREILERNTKGECHITERRLITFSGTIARHPALQYLHGTETACSQSFNFTSFILQVIYVRLFSTVYFQTACLRAYVDSSFICSIATSNMLRSHFR